MIGLGAMILLFGMSGHRSEAWVEGPVALVYQGLLAVGAVVTGYSLFGITRERFVGPSGPFGESWPFDGVENLKTGVWIFLASDVILFGAFIGSAVFLRVAHGWQDWHHLIPAEHVVLPGLINTYILLTSSFTVVLALVAAEKENRPAVVASLMATLVLGVGFLANKAVEWLHLMHVEWTAPTGDVIHGWWISTNAASSTFYLTTGLHGLHVIIGLAMVAWMIVRAWKGAYLGEEEGKPIEYFGLYWHFVDIVWLFLFPLFYIL